MLARISNAELYWHHIKKRGLRHRNTGLLEVITNEESQLIDASAKRFAIEQGPVNPTIGIGAETAHQHWRFASAPQLNSQSHCRFAKCSIQDMCCQPAHGHLVF